MTTTWASNDFSKGEGGGEIVKNDDFFEQAYSVDHSKKYWAEAGYDPDSHPVG